MKPPLKWAGGKAWLAPRIAEVFWPHAEKWPGARYVEPMCGAAGVAFHLQYPRTHINDINIQLVSFMRHLRNGVIEWPYVFDARISAEQHYYYLRDYYNELESKRTALAAKLFLVLNKTCYNGLWRVNKDGRFNVPWGHYKKVSLPESLEPWSKVMKHWTIGDLDFSEVGLLPHDFVYVDPPYDGTFAAFTPGGFGWEEQVRLALWVSQQHDVTVVVSNAASPRIISLYRGLKFEIHSIKGRSARLNRDGKGRGPTKEILAIRTC